MSVQVENLEKNMAKLTIEVSAEELEKALQSAYLKQKKNISSNIISCAAIDDTALNDMLLPTAISVTNVFICPGSPTQHDFRNFGRTNIM